MTAIVYYEANYPRPQRRGPRPRCVVLWTAVVLASPTVSFAQRAELKEKLKQLNVRHTTDHYLLAGTLSDSQLQIYGQALEYIYRQYEKGFSEILKNEAGQDRKTSGAKKARRGKSRRGKRSSSRRGGRSVDEDPRTINQDDAEHRFRVIVFNNRRQYYEFGRAFLGGSEYTNGKYVPSCKLLLVLDQGNLEETREVLFHEAFHQFMRRYIKKAPVWINEGLATHYGHARPSETGLTFSRAPTAHWKLMRELFSKRQAIPLWNVVSASRHEFDNREPITIKGFEDITRGNIYYTEAYTLVHTLLNHPAGLASLRGYLRDLASDQQSNTDSITRKYFGPDLCERLTPIWINHVNSKPERGR